MSKKEEKEEDVVLKRLALRESIESYKARAERLTQRADERLKRAFQILKEAASE